MREEFTKRYYKIREVADLLGVPQTTLRYWEREFEGLSPRRSTHNQRFYSPADIELLQIIHYLLHTKGMKIDNAREYLKHNKKNLSRKLDVIDKLESVKKDLETLLHTLNLRYQKL